MTDREARKEGEKERKKRELGERITRKKKELRERITRNRQRVREGGGRRGNWGKG